MRSVRYTLWVSVLACRSALPLMAQQEQPQPSLSDLQGKQTALDAAESNVLRQWMSERIAAVCADDAVAGGKALGALRSEFKGTESFKEAYIAMLIESVSQVYKGAKLAAAAQLLTLLNTFDDPGARPVLLEALKDQRVGIRTAAAIGLRRLRVKIALAGVPVFTETLNGLRDAGKRETATVALKAIYQAMNYPEAVPSPPDPKVNALAVLDLLEARARQYASDTVQALGADPTGLKLSGALSRALDDAEKKRLVIAAATMMKYAVTSYTGGKRPLFKVTKDDSRQVQASRDQTELLIVAAEDLLFELLSPRLDSDKTIATAMKRAADATDMKIAMNKWGDILKPVVGMDFYMDMQTEPAPDERDDGGDNG